MIRSGIDAQGLNRRRAAWPLLILIGSTIGCAPRLAQTRDSSAPTLEFRNATPDQVRVYLRDGSSDWPLGRAEPMQTVLLRLPPGVRAKPGVLMALVVLPQASGLSPGSHNPAAIRSAPEPAENLLHMRWTFHGYQLYSLPPRPGARLTSLGRRGR
jgi:hypothetical protein